MKVTKETYYAIKMLKYLSKAGNEKIVPAREISNNEIPFIFALRILSKLVDKGLLESFRGTKGGFRLKKDEISYYEIIKVTQPNFNTLKYMKNIKKNDELILEFKNIRNEINESLKKMKITKINSSI